MNNFLALTKVFFLSGFNVNQKKKNQKSAFGLLGLTLGLLAIGSFSISYLFVNQYKEIGMNINMMLVAMSFMAMMLNLILSMYQLQGIIFNTKDYEFLESLPVSKTCIISSKLFATYFINVAEDLALIIPCVIVYLLNGGEFLIGLLTIVTAIFLSFLPILVSTIIGVTSALAAARSRHSNIINIIISLLFFVVLFGGYLYLVYGGPEKLNVVLENVFFLKWLINSVLGDYIYLLYFILFNLGSAIIVILFVSLLYRPVNSKLNAANTHVDYDKVKKNINTDLNLNKVLLKKEWSLIYRKPTYFINSILGNLFYLIIGLTFILIPDFFVANPDVGEMPTIALVFAGLVPGMGIMMNSIASPASTNVSMEGRLGLELLKSYPIDTWEIIKAKIKISILITLILNFVISIILTIVLFVKNTESADLIMAIFLYPQFAGIVLALASMIIGLRWPKIDFENDTQVFKNSAAANLPMLFVFLPSILLVVLNTVLYVFGTEIVALRYVAVGTVSLLYIIIILILYKLLRSVGPKLYDKIVSK